jgi:hypothetical protein
VTITGTGFASSPPVDDVWFNAFISSTGEASGTPATIWSAVNDTTITATVPTGATTGRILVATAGTDASSTNNFVVKTGGCAGGEHERSVTFTLTNHLTAKGRLTVKDGFNECRLDATVKIQRKSGGKWKTVGTDQTTGVGNYRVNIPDKPGTYRASVLKNELNGGDDVCAGVTSATKKHHH